ncbi:MAG: hypothetical protein HDR20_03460 [Lachnospiraceae bacterium]|nr:hypothetical protein [Lachnospiraceae bacterium]
MSKKDLEHIISKINEAELVLVGLGEELDLTRQIREDACALSDADRSLAPFFKKNMLDKIQHQNGEVYDNLAKCLKDKNYFIVSVCMDGTIQNSSLNKERIVEPCGNYERMQCSEKCTSDLYELPQEFLDRLKDKVQEEDKNNTLPICPHCKKPLVFNNVEAENYVEEGYMAQWMLYKKWLQGTVNKNVCILELGVGMKYPTVIRWPFEKIAFFNQKSEMFRVHSRLYQMAEEIRDRGYGICQSPEDFLKELSNGF